MSTDNIITYVLWRIEENYPLSSNALIIHFTGYQELAIREIGTGHQSFLFGKKREGMKEHIFRFHTKCLFFFYFFCFFFAFPDPVFQF